MIKRLICIVVFLLLISPLGSSTISILDFDDNNVINLAPTVTTTGGGSNSSGGNLTQAQADTLYWRLDAANDPPTSNWDMGNFGFLNLGNTNITGDLNMQGGDHIFETGSEGRWLTAGGLMAGQINQVGGAWRFTTSNGISPSFNSDNATSFYFNDLRTTADFIVDWLSGNAMTIDGATGLTTFAKNISAPNVCYSNGTGCSATSSANLTNVAFLNNTQNFTGTNIFTGSLETTKDFNLTNVGITTRRAINFVNVTNGIRAKFGYFFNTGSNSYYWWGRNDTQPTSLSDGALMRFYDNTQGRLEVFGDTPEIRMRVMRSGGGTIAQPFAFYAQSTSTNLSNYWGGFIWYGEMNSGSTIPSMNYIGMGSHNNTAFNNVTVKITPSNRVGIGISGTTQPSYPLDVRTNVSGISISAEAGILSNTLNVTGLISAGQIGTNATRVSAGYFTNLTGSNITTGDLIFSNGMYMSEPSGTSVCMYNNTRGLVGCFNHDGSYTLAGSSTEPTCDSTTRGKQILLLGGVGVADVTKVCIKTALDTYTWIPTF